MLHILTTLQHNIELLHSNDFFYYLELLKEMPYLSSPLFLRDATSSLIALTLSTRAVLCVPLLLPQCERYVVSLFSSALVRCRIPRLDSGLKIILSRDANAGDAASPYTSSASPISWICDTAGTMSKT